jgi:peptidoglycan/xylan/chitin deacetylase (PgdA/CDA1 family)
VALLTFALDGETPILAMGRRYSEYAMAMTHQAFEPRVAVPRLLALLDDYDLQATFFVPGLVAERWPGMVTSVAEAGHEVAHHSYSHRPPTDLSAAEDRAEFERGLGALDALGIKPRGYRAPMWAATWRTPELVREFGMAYDSSLMDDDRPYLINTNRGDLVEVPPHWSLDDWEQYAYLADPHIGFNIESPDKALGMWRAELDAMRRHHCLFVLTNHAFLSGRAGRVEGLRALIEYALGTGDVAFDTAAGIAARVASDPRAERRQHQPYQPDPEVYPQW